MNSRNRHALQVIKHLRRLNILYRHRTRTVLTADLSFPYSLHSIALVETFIHTRRISLINIDGYTL